MQIKTDAPDVWGEYQKGVRYNQSINLYDNVKTCENFYIGKQWEGLNAPDLPKPVLNVIHRVVSYFIAMLVADDIAVSVRPWMRDKIEIPDDATGGIKEITKQELDAKAIEQEIDRTVEQACVKELSREIIRDAAVCGDSYLYFYFDPDRPCGRGAQGAITAELIGTGSVIYANPYCDDAQRQPYIIIASPRYISDVREMAIQHGMSKERAEDIREDDDPLAYSYNETSREGLCTLITKLWRDGGTIHAMQCTQDVVIREPWDTKYTRYPIASFVWDKIKNSYHGMSAVLPAIPNQISINQLYAMGIHYLKTNVFPKILFDETKIPKWDNKVGQAIGVIGNPNEAIAASFRGGDMSAQVFQMLDKLAQSTAEYMGANDAALGNIKPDNTSAIIATQKASAMPLELQRLAFNRFTEDYIRIIIDMIRADYGTRRVSVTVDGADFDGEYDFAALDEANYDMAIDIGSAAYWGELTQIQTADNLLAKNIIPDPETYLDTIPDKYVKNKNKILDKIRAQRKAQEDMAQQAQAMPQGAPQMPQGMI